MAGHGELQVFESQLLGLDKGVDVIGADKAHAGDVIGFEYVEYLQRGDALSVGRQLVHIPAAVVGRHGSDPFRRVRRHVVVTQQPALLGHVGIDAPRNVAFVERVAPPLRDRLERVGEAPELLDELLRGVVLLDIALPLHRSLL